MSSPVGWAWPALAGAATVVALVEHGVPWIALGAGAFAVGAAALGLLRTLRPPELRPLPEPVEPGAPPGVRELFLAGPLGREDLLLRVDWLERSRGGAPRRTTGLEEKGRLARMPPEQFRTRLSAKLARIEEMS